MDVGNQPYLKLRANQINSHIMYLNMINVQLEKVFINLATA
jgi:hypothetical protein